MIPSIFITACSWILVSSQTTELPHQSEVYDQLHVIFDSLNTNGDGFISFQENLAYFDDMDTNGDGQIDFDEFLRARATPVGTRGTPEILRATFQYYDKIAGEVLPDGYMLRNESAIFFHMLDLDGDGRSTLQEFDVGYVKIMDGIQREFNLLLQSGEIGK